MNRYDLNSKVHLKLNSGIHITVRFFSPHNRKHRRALLLGLFRASKEHLRYLHVNELFHADEPLQTTLSTMLRGTKAPDALSMKTVAERNGYYVRLVRTKMDLSQEQFANALQISQSLLSQIEHGKRNPSPQLRYKIENLFNPQPQWRESSLQNEPNVQPVLH